jgi:hypothetical protein
MLPHCLARPHFAIHTLLVRGGGVGGVTIGVGRTAVSFVLVVADLKYRTLFAFDFESHGNGMKLARGSWNGRRKGEYQFAIASPSTFLISVSLAPTTGIFEY